MNGGRGRDNRKGQGMTRTVHARGDDLAATVTSAIAQVLDCDERKITVELAESTKANEFTGRVVMDLEVPEQRTQAEGDAADSSEGLDEEAEAAADFLEGLLDAMDLPGDLRLTLHDDHAAVEVVEIGSGALIGRRGQTLEAIQELVRCALQRQFQRRSRVMIDAEGYRARRLEKLLEKAEEAIDEVLASGEPERLEPMDVFERKAVHHLVAEVEGIESHSQGREPARRVVIERS